MKKFHQQKGFTLVELAIVMTIIGLLIGGILKGQELMENARVTSTIAQVKSYEAATTTFRDTFSAIPGDMANAAQRLPNCSNAKCQATGTTAGNSIVGPSATDADLTTAQVTTTGPINTATAAETILFWSHLLLADLISGVTDGYASGGASPKMAWGESHPSAKIGGGFLVGFANGSSTTVAPFAGTQRPSGMVLMLIGGPTDAPSAATGTQALSPLRAAQIDRKMDDGQPASGFIRGFGNPGNSSATPPTPGCFDAGVTPNIYIETQTQKDCGLSFRIQG